MDQLGNATYNELHRSAKQLLRHERADHTLDSVALVSEVWIGLQKRINDLEKPEFFRIAGRAMRNILVDYARSRNADKRLHKRSDRSLATLSVGVVTPDDVLELDIALGKLSETDRGALKVELIELVYFAGLSLTGAAETMGVTRDQARGLWTVSRLFLERELH